MNSFLLFFKNLKTAFSKSKITFILILICVFCSSIILCFSYGLFQNYNVIIENNKIENQELKSLYINFNNINGNFVTQESLEKTLLKINNKVSDNIDNISVNFQINEYTEIAKKHSAPSTIMSVFTVKNGHFNIPQLYFNNITKEQNGRTLLTNGRVFTQEEIDNRSKVIILYDNSASNTDALFDETKINGYINLYGEKYDVIGGNLLCSVIPFTSIDSKTEMLNCIEFMFGDGTNEGAEMMTRSEYNNLKELFETEFGELVTVPVLEIPEIEMYYLYNTIIIIAVLIAVVSAIIFALLYQSVLLERKKTLSVFRLCGCSKRRAVFIYLSECLTMSVPIFILATVFYANILLRQLSRKFEYIEAAYSTIIYIVIFAIYFTVQILILLLMIYTNIPKKAIKEALQ